MWTLHPKHKMANFGFLFHRTPFDREYPHPLGLSQIIQETATVNYECDMIIGLSQVYRILWAHLGYLSNIGMLWDIIGKCLM